MGEPLVARSDAVGEQTVLVDADIAGVDIAGAGTAGAGTAGAAHVRLAKPVLGEHDTLAVSKSAVQASIAESQEWDHTPEQNKRRCQVASRLVAICHLFLELGKHLTDSALC